MHVVFILSISLNAVGPSNHLMKDIIMGLVEKGHKITLIERTSKNNQSSVEWLKHPSINRIILNKSEEVKKNFIFRYLNELKYSLKVRAVIKKTNNIDCVFCQSCNTPYVYFLRNYKIPFIYNPQDLFPDNLLCITKLTKKSFVYKFFHSLQKFAYEKSTHIITISEDMKNTIVSSYGIDDKKISIVHNWGNFNEVQSIRNEENYFFKDNSFSSEFFNVVYAGNIGKMQNVEVILSIADKLQHEKIKFYIVGNGANYLSINSEAKERELQNIVFLPSQSSENAIYVYSAADLNIIPLVKDGIYTALPSKTANCIASGKQILACINKESEFANLLIKHGYKAAEIDDIDKMSEIILNLKSKEIQKHNPEELLQYFKIENSKEYINIIENIKEELTSESI